MSSPNPTPSPQPAVPANGAASAEQVQQVVATSGSEQVPYSEPKSVSEEFLTDEQLRQELSGHKDDVATPDQIKMLDDFMGKSGKEVVARARQEVGEQTTSTPAVTQPSSQPSTPPQAFTPQPASVQAPAPSPREALLEQQLMAMSAQLQQVQQRLAQPPQPQAPQAPQRPPSNPNLQVNAGLVQALGSEDPAQRQLAVQALVDGIWGEVYAHVNRQVPEMIQGHVPGMIQANLTASQRGQQIEQDFYGTFPEFRDMQDLVAAQAQSMIGQGWVGGWNQQFRDELARRLAPLRPTVLQRLGAPQPQIPQPQIPAQQPYYPQMAPAQPPAQAAWPQPVQPAPLMVRDASGALRPYSGPQQYAPQQVAQPMVQRLTPQQAEVMDIWSTLGYR